MGTGTAINFQPAGADKAAATGDFVLLAGEVGPVMRALRSNGIEVTALHTHMLGEKPTIYFMHFWAVENTFRLACDGLAQRARPNKRSALTAGRNLKAAPSDGSEWSAPRPREHSAGGLLAIAAAVLFGLSTPAAKSIVGNVPPLLLAGLLYLGSGVGLGVITLLGQRHGVRAQTRRLSLAAGDDLWRSAWTGLLCGA